MDYNAFITLSTGSKHKITPQTYEQILQADKDDLIRLPDGTVFKNSAVMEIQDISEWTENHYSYGQPYQALPPGIGFEGVITSAKRLSALEAMARGLKKAKEKIQKKGGTTRNIDNLLDLARKRYALITKTN